MSVSPRPGPVVLARDPSVTVPMTPPELPLPAASVPMGMDDLTLVVLAAGGGTRMRSRLAKPLHPVAGRPMIEHVLRAGMAAGPDRMVVVVSERLADLDSRLPGHDVTLVVQDQALGTADAVRRVFDRPGLLPASGRMLVLYGDQPLLDTETVSGLARAASLPGQLVTLLTCVVPDAAGYGRIARNAQGLVHGIVERRDDDASLRVGPTEIWSGMMALDVAWARAALGGLTPSAATGELYLTGLVEMAVVGAGTGAWPVGTVEVAPEVAYGVNDRVELAEAERLYRDRVRRRLMVGGVTMQDPSTTVVDDDVTVGPDTTILPFTRILAGTTIGRDCVIGPGAEISGATIGDGVTVRSSTVTGATVHDGADVGPYSHLRAGTIIGPGAHVGNFGEFKNAHLAEGVKAGHFGYLGDVSVGANTNIGAGTVVANFDGRRKHRTTIGADAFIGSDTVLRAPVTVGDGAATGAGSVVTRDVPPGVTVVGVPARPVGREPRPDEDRDDATVPDRPDRPGEG
ncbi:MAG: N-acetylglucosamine-1-phosphate uridyltransferase / Glucosamine-1-phosphate N-acetyltransferase [uncultured Thermomicrobiales bacterium]|uniref:Bifunctional protein GlmU n=1 Tax=uncultured Thermomicrobiales bacterium TaxID=1645740 RepID=A0A6J4UHF3_9BACT|nr:MAG: N-acetylglucosamine-1-phosphate uridyltransferase / Glucosamine-1-phosphate N-acetyltransferase [uncultured Thermomicrobiales bacterium]